MLQFFFQIQLNWAVKFKEKSHAPSSYMYLHLFIFQLQFYYNCAKNLKNRAGKCANRVKIGGAILSSRIARYCLTAQQLKIIDKMVIHKNLKN